MSPRRERELVPEPEFRSYYGRPIVKEPVWKVPDVPAYLFAGGAAGVSASMAALAELTGRPKLARAGRLVAAGGALFSVGALVHDLGRPLRFLHMLRVFKPTSPLSVGSWILSPFSGLATAAAASELTGLLPRAGRLAGFGAAALGPPMCTYTAVLLADTAMPAWHEAHRELPYLFAGSALSSAAGAAMVTTRPAEHGPARMIGLIGAVAELVVEPMVHRHGLVTETWRTGRPGRLLNAARILTATGATLSVLGRRSRLASTVAGMAYLAGGLCTRFWVFEAGVVSARDPKYIVVPQRERLSARRSNNSVGTVYTEQQRPGS
jgi:formate-dependent nitrite reductase membrane component NrfD